MKFINPKVDYAFKKIFGSEQSKEILISFLNGIVYGGEKIIQSLTIVNPYNPGQIITLKETYLDIKAVLADNSIVIIEMQVAPMTAFSKRIMYNLAKGYANQLVRGEDYPKLNPAIAVTITDFILFKKTENVINKFVFKEEQNNFVYPHEELKLIFVELPKFKKTLSELESLTDKWIYFLKETPYLDSIPSSLGEISEIELAYNFANQANMTLEELDQVDRRGIFLQDERGKITYAQEKGEQIGEQRGLEKGRLREIALIMRLLKKRFGEIPTEISSKIENLTIEKLENLGEDFLDFNSINDLEDWLNN